MSNDKYISSVINKYGDTAAVKVDISILLGIITRQGNLFVLDALAETVGYNANRLKLTNDERTDLRNAILADLRDALDERL